MSDCKYKTLEEYRNAVLEGKHPKARIRIDNDQVLAFEEFGWDEETDEPEVINYLWMDRWPREALLDALNLLGLEAEHA